MNPRRWLIQRKGTFEGYPGIVRGLHRISGQLRLIIIDASYLDEPRGAMTSSLAAVLEATAEMTDVLGDLHSVPDLHRLDELDSHVRNGKQCCGEIAEHVEQHHREQPEEWLSSEALHTDLRRLLDECNRVRDELESLRKRRTAGQ